MGDKKRILEEFDQARNDMRAIVKVTNPETAIYREWGIKEVLVHILGWEEIVRIALQRYLTGDELYILPSKTIDEYNTDMVEKRKSLGCEQVVRTWERTRNELRQVIDGMKDRHFEERIVFLWGPEGEIKEMLSVIAYHEQEHAQEIRQMKEKG